MHRSTLPPPHPSLPKPPTSAYASPTYQAQPSTSHLFPTYVGSHYAQAYAPPAPSPAGYFTSTLPAGSSYRPSHPPAHTVSAWYQPGNNRCSQAGCTFSGSQKTVEVHMMDRHLIYPPGWEKRKKNNNDWDADPSLKGKPIPIQGTNVILDTPEVLEAWIAERKRRFPTASRVEEKKRKMEEAIARGQLDLNDAGSRPNKRRRVEEQNIDLYPVGRNGQSVRGRPGGARIPDTGWRQRPPQNTPKVDAIPVISADSEDSEDDDGDSPDIISSKVTIAVEAKENAKDTKRDILPTQVRPNESGRSRKNVPQEPRPPPRNPFASRPTLLRNLLLPEIRVTVSNLSQSIRFLVDNDFLRDVELKPGQAAEQNKIHVLENPLQS